MDIQETIKDQIGSNKVVLYMKGTPQFPQCGFSALAVEVLKRCLPEGTELKTFNILLDPDLRQGIKEYSSWPTIPQLYLNGEFVGGSDIIKQLYEEGELQKMIGADKDPGGETPS